MKDLVAQFRNPGPDFRGKPFWSWNGNLEEEELIRQVHVMKEMGLGGFFMHSRTGLATEYLGDEWFRLTNACADEAERLGMEAWLYDEDRWPSGTAGGSVTENPDFRLKFMSLRVQTGEEFIWRDGITAAFSCELNGVVCSNCKKNLRDAPPSEYCGKMVLVFDIEQMAPSTFYNGNTYVDTMNLQATERYIELTHERYRRRCGERLGRSVHGIFTDEPHRGAVFSGFGIDNENRLWMTPWSDALPDLYKQQFSGDLIAHLPDLFLSNEGASVSPVKWRYMELLQQMFLANFASPLYAWCEANGLQLTGHALHEDSLTSQACMQGSLMRFYEYLHCPGVDILTESNRSFVVVKQVASVARQLGQKWLLSELYGCTGWQMNFRSHKEVGDWQAVLGINLRCHHLSWYTMEGEAKRDFPGSILHQSAWWRDYDYVETYFARLGLFLAQGTPVCDVLIINPVESLWCQIGVGWAEGLSPLTAAVQLLEERYAELSSWLLGSQIDFDYGDEEMMGRLATVEADTHGAVMMRVGKALYKTVVVGCMTTMRYLTLRLLEDFSSAGGDVIIVGDPPEYVDAYSSSQVAALASNCRQTEWSRDEFLKACRDNRSYSVFIVDTITGEPVTDILCQERRVGNAIFLVLMNTSRDREIENVYVQLPGFGHVEEWNCRSGDRAIVPSQFAGGCTAFRTSFGVSEERAFLMTPLQDADLSEAFPDPPTGHITCGGPFAYTLGEENVCVLDFARFRLNDEAWSPSMEVLQVDNAVRQRLNLPQRGGEMVQPWFRIKHEPEPLPLARLALEVTFYREDLVTGPITLCAERPEQWRFVLNGIALSNSSNSWWVDKAFERVELPESALRLGANVLLLETEFRQDTNLEAVYLIGDFGVRLSGGRTVLTQRPNSIPVGDLTRHGFPFYGGSISYVVPLPQGIKAEKLHVQIPEFEAACVKALVPGRPTAMIAFPPFSAEVPGWQCTDAAMRLDVVLTRRNTFGPLHQVPLRSHAYGPGNYITTGKDFSPEYMLYPAGLLAPPIISWT